MRKDWLMASIDLKNLFISIPMDPKPKYIISYISSWKQDLLIPSFTKGFQSFTTIICKVYNQHWVSF